MKIFYIEFDNTQGISKKKLQSALGRHIAKEVARVFYDVTAEIRNTTTEHILKTTNQNLKTQTYALTFHTQIT